MQWLHHFVDILEVIEGRLAEVAVPLEEADDLLDSPHISINGRAYLIGIGEEELCPCEEGESGPLGIGGDQLERHVVGYLAVLDYLKEGRLEEGEKPAHVNFTILS